ncbi:sugar phosphate isomerase/epimerase [Agrococcus sp. BE272]|uniref:sugar phosphate isomerase/epimerase family protein n=1 Tax=Agrococcus sp. BE272 TaxID=2817727 RepID=UPI00285CAE11|nr:sugar phosphate isomerase/epimerase [Agrococcus sp. BE272]MDR7233656.1 sugar phosphate isomerase/epimerase [Agrococcus sp. BE272]
MTPPADLPQRLGCSTISFQHLPLEGALAEIERLGFAEIDLGALPGVCDHVPFELDDAAIAQVAASIAASGLRVRSVNGDVGAFNDPGADASAQAAHVDRLLALTAAVGADALVLPCGALGHEPLDSLDADLERVAAALARAADAAAAHGVEVWVESLHFLRLCFDRERAEALHALLAGSGVRPILDVAHVVAAGDDLPATIRAWGADIAHVHLRDAVPGEFSRPIGAGSIDFPAAFAALADIGYAGGFALELPSRAYVDDATGAMDDAARAARVDAIRDAAARMAPLVAGLDLTHPSLTTESLTTEGAS